MKAKYKLVYNRKKRLNKENKGVIQIERYLGGKRKYISTGIYIEPRYWNENQKQINSRHNNYMQLNNLLRRKIVDIENYEYSIINKGKTFSLDYIDDFLKGKNTKVNF